MGKHFDDVHALWQSQLTSKPCEVADSDQVKTARLAAKNYEGYVLLGDALSKQLRYREAAEAYSEALQIRPNELPALRLRAGRYLSTLQWDKARADLTRCLELGADRLDITYRLGLCAYLRQNYGEAMNFFEKCLPLCSDEMGIAVIYWHTLSAYRCGAETVLLGKYHTGMDIGHHTAYEKAMGICAGVSRAEDALEELENEPDDLEYVIVLYGVCGYLMHSGGREQSAELMENLLSRDGFWPCYAYLAAWNDGQRKGAPEY